MPANVQARLTQLLWKDINHSEGAFVLDHQPRVGSDVKKEGDQTIGTMLVSSRDSSSQSADMNMNLSAATYGTSLYLAMQELFCMVELNMVASMLPTCNVRQPASTTAEHLGS